MNALSDWVRRSREEQRRAPERYLANYPELVMDSKRVIMSKETFDKIRHHCGRYDGTYPTGAYLGKMFLRGECLCWFTFSKSKPMTNTGVEFRTIEIVE